MGRVRYEPITWERLTDALADRIAGLHGGTATGTATGSAADTETGSAAAAAGTAEASPWRRVALDGAPATRPGELARGLADALRVRGRSALVVAADGFLRPASLRFEHGRRDPDAYYDLWYDTGALWREVFAPLDPGGDGRVLPDLWDPERDRATRSEPVRLPAGGVLLLHGPLLLGHWFPFDLSVHLRLSAGALARRTDPGEQWTLPAFERYARETAPEEAADVVVRADDPRRPAWNGAPLR